MSFDAYVKFIEDDFLGGRRLDPQTDGRPDPRPDVRENASVLGDLSADFDFRQHPRPPELLPEHPRTTLSASAPYALTTPAAQPANNAATVTWTPPKIDGGAPITGYIITPRLGGVPQPPRTLSHPDSAATVTGLRNGERYSFTIAAVNKVGIGIAATTTVIQIGAPTSPQDAYADGAATVTLTWRPPAADNGAPITSYKVTGYANFATAASRTVPASVHQLTFTGLKPAVTYRFTITAINTNGAGPPAIAKRTKATGR